MSESISLASWQLMACLGLLALVLGISLSLQLKMERSILLASARMVVQLLVIGFLLEKIFHLQQLWLVGLVGLVMVGVAVHANGQRVVKRPPFFWWSSVLSVSLCAFCSLAFALFVIADSDPWYSPRFFIPFLGLILGNALTGVSLGMDSIINSMEEQADQVSAFLALGASPREAGFHLLKKAIKTATTPILNGMTITGIVALPGVMTGQILAGAPPEQAAHYQIAIMCLLCFSTFLASTLGVFVFYFRQFGAGRHLREA